MQRKANLQFSSKLIGLMAVVWTLTLIGCNGGLPSNNSNGIIADTCDIGSVAARSNYSIESGSINQIASDISENAGKVIASGNGRTDRMIVVFEETHTSGLGQLEIALMLLRLQNKHGLRQVSLEGAIAGGNDLSAKWFHDLPNSQDVNEAKEKVAARLLNEGEINCGEFISLVSPDVQVKGNERADEYAVTMSDKSSTASLRYLFAIAEKSALPNTIQQVNQLAKQNKQQAAIEVLFNSDAWVSERYKKLKNEDDIVSIEELIKLDQEIESKANEIKVYIDEETRAGMRDQLTFFKTASKRSCTMVNNTLNMCDQTPSNPIALIIGAAHTSGVINLLKASKASYAVISPKALADKSKVMELSLDDYKLKLNKKSVDSENKLGAYLNSPRKPPVVTGEKWLQAKAETYLAISLLAGAAGSGKKPPFQDLTSELNSFKHIKIDPSSYEIIKKGNLSAIMFKVTAPTDDNRTVDLWVGGWMEPPNPPPNPPTQEDMNDPNGRKKKSLESMVEKMVKEGRKGKTTNKSTVIQISDDVKAAFTKTPAAVKAAIEKG